MRKVRTVFVLIGCWVAFFQTAPIAFATRLMPYYNYWKLVDDVSKDTSTPEKRAQVIMVLLGIVKRDSVDVHLKGFAVEKLGDLGASEARDSLKELAERLTWSDTTRHLKSTATLAYWKIRVAEEKTTEAQEDLLIQLLWAKNHPPPHSSGIPWWAAEELANRGVSRALPEIAASIRSINSTLRAEQFIQLCSAKIELLNSSPNRLEALKKALGNTDPVIGQDLRRWAIIELGRLGTPEAIEILINYAMDLQTAYYDYDEAGRLRLKQGIDKAYVDAAECYNMVLGVLRSKGMSDAEIAALGLKPRQCFPG